MFQITSEEAKSHPNVISGVKEESSNSKKAEGSQDRGKSSI
ncbi:hypothetical protein HanXRQr2_Chr14g0625571 [Helianthus annuus]|uniref:Uncharacterized protein n=2 Tax=Helianthus annuus TaxID=4232 RepID=A0A9K3H5V2_HELAN|nr:hypothetical protein HanXRQr2_Chr14g0625571 [Helianthus annuus]